MPKKLKQLIPLVIILAVAAALVYYLNWVARGEDGPLTASGTVEAVEVVVSPEMNGRVDAILVSEGEVVQVGDSLLRLDGELLQAQRVRAEKALNTAEANLQVAHAAYKSAQSAVETAQIQYELALQAAHLEDAPSRASAWEEDIPDEFQQPVWYFEKSEEIASAQVEVEEARDALERSQANLDSVLQEASNDDVVKAEKRLVEARAAYLVAQDVLERAKGDEEIEDEAQAHADAAESELETAQEDYDQMLSEDSAKDVLEARARLAVSRERYETALDRWYQLLTGEESLQVQSAQQALVQARTQAAQVETQITQAERAVEQAQAELDLLDIQLEKLTVKAAISGVVLSRNVEPGEVLKAGGAAMTLGQLDDLTLTVYIPEDRYGEVNLGDQPIVSVDSFPGETFSAEVIRIANQAEYTPRNVQTAEGRRSTVFAVELAVLNPQGKLKPGMPADVEFGD